MPGVPTSVHAGPRAARSHAVAAPDLGSRLRAFLMEEVTPASRTLERAGALFSALTTLGGVLSVEATDLSPDPSAVCSRVAASLSGTPCATVQFHETDQFHETVKFHEIRSVFSIEDSPAPRRAMRELTDLLLPSGRFRAVMAALSGECPEDYTFQRRARSFGLSLLRLQETARLIEGLPFVEATFCTFSTATEAGALGAELGERLGVEPAPLFVVGLSAVRSG